jgi:hypothetical protein
MVKFSTKYFGEISTKENETEIILDTFVNFTGNKQEISIIIDIDNIFTKMDICIKILDDYEKICNNGKKILKTEISKNNNMKKFLYELSEKYGKVKMSEILKIKNIVEINMEEIIEKMNYPNIRLDLKNGNIEIFLLFGISDEIDEMIVIKLDKNYKMEDINYYE